MIQFPALLNKNFAGEIYYIGGIGQDRKDASSLGDDLGKTDVTVFNTKIKLSKPSKDLRPGMSAVVSFESNLQPQKSVYVPRTFVSDNNGAYTVQVQQGAVIEPRIVEGVAISDEYFKVVAGLNDGELLIIWRDTND